MEVESRRAGRGSIVSIGIWESLVNEAKDLGESSGRIQNSTRTLPAARSSTLNPKPIRIR